MATNPATADVAITNWPSVQAVSGSLFTVPPAPDPSDLLRGAVSATGTLITVPAGRIWYGNLTLSCSVAVAGTSNPKISSANAGAGSDATTGDLLQITSSGLLAAASGNSNSAFAYIYGGTAGATVTFTAGAAGVSFGQANGILL